MEQQYDFTGSSHDGVRFTGTFRDTSFVVADLRACALVGTFINCDFTGAVFHECDFTGTFIDCIGLPAHVYVLTDED